MDAHVSQFEEPAITDSFAFLFQTCRPLKTISLKEHFIFIALALTLAGGQVFIY